VASARLREPPLGRDYVCITATAEDFTSTLLTRAGQCLAVSLIMTGIAFATGPVANADLKSLLACICEGTKMVSSCCIDEGGAYSFTPPSNHPCTLHRLLPTKRPQPSPCRFPPFLRWPRRHWRTRIIRSRQRPCPLCQLRRAPDHPARGDVPIFKSAQCRFESDWGH
jgi:hypothetical protein